MPALRQFWGWWAILALGAATFLMAPGGFAEKARLVLHGLCAQTPSHSFTFGGLLLPFDARMTGIYAGSICAFVVLGMRRRLLFGGLPKRSTTIVLALPVLALAADGSNSLFNDLGLWHPWEPRNLWRVITGWGTGVTLAVVLAWLLASSAWKIARPEPAIRFPRELITIYSALPVYLVLLYSGWTWLYVPLSLVLMLSAWLVLSSLTLSMILLAFRWDDLITRAERLHRPGAMAAVAGLAAMLVLAFGRRWLEHVTGVPSTLGW